MTNFSDKVISNMKHVLFIFALSALLGCTAVSETAVPVPTVPPAETNNRIEDHIEHNFRQWARFDAIPPVYEPEFVGANDVSIEDNELVMGVTLGGEAKAYPVTSMQFREMVNDELAGVPILVTW